jgi:hypothetical protein
MVAMRTLDAAADELYGLPVAQFTARRNALAAEARTAGDRDLAEQIGALRRPTMVGWLVNQLVREHPEEIDPLLALGQALREATAGLQGQQLRELAGQQRQLVAAMITQTRAIAAAASQRVSEDTARGVADTLHAALSDPDAAAQVRSGRLTDGLAPSGFAGVLAPSTPVPVPRRGAERAGEDDPAQQARADVDAAQSAADQARAALAGARKAVDHAEAASAATAARVQELREALRAGDEERAQAVRQARAAHDDLAEADRRARDAQRGLEEARARLKRVGTSEEQGGAA